MKHCVCVIEESVVGIGLHNFYVYVKTPERVNDLPTLPDCLNSDMKLAGVELELKANQYKQIGEALPGTGFIVPSLAEFVLNEFWAVDFLFYDPQGKFVRRQLYEMQLGSILKSGSKTEKVSS